jgi:hypothetical protein
VVVTLEQHCTAVNPSQELTLLKVRQVAADRLGGHVELAGEVGDVDRALLQRKHVDLALAVMLEPGTA